MENTFDSELNDDYFDEALDRFIASEKEACGEVNSVVVEEYARMPEIVAVEVSRSKGRRGVGEFDSEPLVVRLHFAECLAGKMKICALCFTSGLVEMGDCTYSRRSGRKGRKSRRLLIEGSNIWMPDDYVIFICEGDNEPRYKISFTLGEADEAVNCRLTPVMCGTDDYIFAKYVYGGAVDEAFREIGGYGDFKWQLVRMRKEVEYNYSRLNWSFGAIEKRHFYCLMGESREWTKSVAKNLHRVVEYYPLSKTYYKGAELVAQVTQGEDSEALTEFLGMSSRRYVSISDVAPLCHGHGIDVMAKIVEAMESPAFKDMTVAICGTKSEIERLFNSVIGLERLIPKENFLILGSRGLTEFMARVAEMLRNAGVKLDAGMEHSLSAKTMEAWNAGLLHGWTMRLAGEVVTNMLDRQKKRLMCDVQVWDGSRPVVFETLFPDDMDYSFLKRGRDTYEECVNDIKSMVGLTCVKEKLDSVFLMSRFRAERRRLGLSDGGGECHHMVFTGNPGTGKTTVAQYIGNVYRSLGLLSKGHLVAVDRSKIVGAYIGETERNMMRCIEKARGGVLFIDEAYSLYVGGDDSKDYGVRALECLLTVLSEPNPDIIVILAGYETEMRRMLDSNPGLDGRFPHKLRFDDYSMDELVQIAVDFVAAKDFSFTVEALEGLRTTVARVLSRKERGFSNARWMLQFMEHGVIPAVARRVLDSGVCDRRSFSMIERVDVESASGEIIGDKNIVRLNPGLRRIGFTA